MTGEVSSHARNHLKLSLHDVARTVETVHMCTGKEIRNLCTYLYSTGLIHVLIPMWL